MEFWFEYGSNYSYVSVMRIEATGAPVSWEPFLLGPIFKDLGWDTSPFVLQEAKGKYVWRDMERQCEKYNLPWRKPSVFPRSGVLAARVALLGGDWVPEFSRRIMIAAAATAEPNRSKLRRQTERAKEKGIFGAPTFIVGGEMYWGNDRLDEAVEATFRASGL